MLVAIAGGAGSGKSLLATALENAVPGCSTLSIDNFYFSHLVEGMPTVVNTEGRAHLDFNHPGAVNVASLQVALERTMASSRFVVLEGLFALALPAIDPAINLRVFVDTPPDIRLIRKIERKEREQAQPSQLTIRNYLASARPGHALYVEPSRQTAQLTLDGLKPTSALVAEVLDAAHA